MSNIALPLRTLWVIIMVASLSACARLAGDAADTTTATPAAPVAVDPDEETPTTVGQSSTPSSGSATTGLSDIESLAAHLGLYVHADNTNFYADMNARKSRLLERNEIVAQCMADRGLEFIGDDPEVVHGYYDGFDIDRNTQAWAARYGFGITTLIVSQDRLDRADSTDAPAVGYPGRAPKAAPPIADGETDPLSSYLETLEDPDRYWTALYGANPDPNTGAYVETSCAGVAAKRVPDPSALTATSVLSGEADAASVLERLSTHQQVVEQEQAGAQCLSDQGFSFTDELDARIAVWDVRGALAEQPEGSASADLPSSYLDSLADAQDFELAAAVAVWDCGVAQAQLNSLKTSLLPEIIG